MHFSRRGKKKNLKKIILRNVFQTVRLIMLKEYL